MEQLLDMMIKPPGKLGPMVNQAGFDCDTKDLKKVAVSRSRENSFLRVLSRFTQQQGHHRGQSPEAYSAAVIIRDASCRLTLLRAWLRAIYSPDPALIRRKERLRLPPCLATRLHV
jgi:hypothetical protein